MSLLKRIFRNKFFYLAVGLEILSMFYPHMDTHYFWQTPLYYFSSADFLYFMLMPLRHGIGNLLLPFVAALPSAIFLAQNRRSKTDLLMNYRYGRRRFVLNQILGTAGGAVLAALLGLFLYTLLVAVASPWHQNIQYAWRNLYGLPFDAWINQYEGMPFLLLNYITLMLTAITWSLVAVSLACFTINLGVVVGGTFLLHYLSSWLLSQVLHISQWSPMVLQAPDIFYNQSIGFMIGRLLCWVLFSLCIAIFCLNRYFSHMKE